MTTGRINQVTIVAAACAVRVAPCGASRRDELLEMSAPGVRRRHQAGRRSLRASASPVQVPQRGTGPRTGGGFEAAAGRDPDPPRVEDRFGRRPSRGPPSRLPPDASVVGVASGQPPTEPILRRPRAGARDGKQGIRPPEEAGDHPAKSPIARRRRAACLPAARGTATKWPKRYGTEGALRRPALAGRP